MDPSKFVHMTNLVNTHRSSSSLDADAVIQQFYPGESGGECLLIRGRVYPVYLTALPNFVGSALADIVFGAVNPSGDISDLVQMCLLIVLFHCRQTPSFFPSLCRHHACFLQLPQGQPTHRRRSDFTERNIAFSVTRFVIV